MFDKNLVYKSMNILFDSLGEGGIFCLCGQFFKTILTSYFLYGYMFAVQTVRWLEKFYPGVLSVLFAGFVTQVHYFVVKHNRAFITIWKFYDLALSVVLHAMQ
jgi:hypothetical protein